MWVLLFDGFVRRGHRQGNTVDRMIDDAAFKCCPQDERCAGRFQFLQEKSFTGLARISCWVWVRGAVVAVSTV